MNARSVLVVGSAWLCALMAGVLLPVLWPLALTFGVAGLALAVAGTGLVCCRGCRFGVGYVGWWVWASGLVAALGNAAYGSDSFVPFLGAATVFSVGAALWVVVRPDDLFGQWCPRGEQQRGIPRIQATHTPEQPTYIGSVRLRRPAVNRAPRALPAGGRRVIDTTSRPAHRSPWPPPTRKD